MLLRSTTNCRSSMTTERGKYRQRLQRYSVAKTNGAVCGGTDDNISAALVWCTVVASFVRPDVSPPPLSPPPPPHVLQRQGTPSAADIDDDGELDLALACGFKLSTTSLAPRARRAVVDPPLLLSQGLEEGRPRRTGSRWRGGGGACLSRRRPAWRGGQRESSRRRPL